LRIRNGNLILKNVKCKITIYFVQISGESTFDDIKNTPISSHQTVSPPPYISQRMEILKKSEMKLARRLDLAALTIFGCLQNSIHPVRIRVRIDPSHPLVCRKRRLNGAVLRMRPEKLRPRVTAGVAR
jgi:hypothetical protein